MSVSDNDRASWRLLFEAHIGLPFRISALLIQGGPMGTKDTEVLETNVAIGLIHRRPGDLKPWPGNPRTHNDKQLAKLKTSIQKFGFTAPGSGR
jgi:hypothetical protein